jgi:CRP-like cAMP-binding protein
LNLNDSIFEDQELFQGLYLVKSGIVIESSGQVQTNRAVGDVLAFGTLIQYMNALINNSELVDTSPESLPFTTTAKAMRESRVVFWDKESLVQMAFTNEKFFDRLYKLYYQYIILRTNVRTDSTSLLLSRADLGPSGHP